MTRTSKKRFKKVWNAVARLVLVVATVVAIFYVTCFLASFGGKIIWTQARMGYYHSKISDLEADREYYQKIASEAVIAEQRKVYQNEADNADKAIQNYSETRKSLHNSSDPIVAFAAKNDFEFSKLLLGLAELLLVLCFVVFMYKIFCTIINMEKAIVDFMLKALFFIIGSLFAFGAEVCFAVSRFFSSGKKQTMPKRK